MTPRQIAAATLAGLLALAAGLVVGRFSVPRPTAAAASATPAPAARKPLYYRNPMGLADTSPVPKKDAMGMDYVAVYADDASAADDAGTVVLSPGKVQQLGVRSEPVRRLPLPATMPASASIELDPTRQYTIAPRFDGWVRTLYADQIGMHLRRGQPLARIYSPQVAATLADRAIADAALARLPAADADTATALRQMRDANRRRLDHFTGGSAAASGDELTLSAPIDGVLVESRVVPGAGFSAGQTILRLADLSTVWIVADIPELQSGAVRVGQSAVFTAPALAGKRFAGKLEFIQQLLDTRTRTLRVRMAMANPDGMLRPGLYGTLVLSDADAAAVLQMPRSALIDSGNRQIALVQVAPGRFTPRRIVVGRRTADRVEVLEGLAEGESVVVSANFLIDAESNLRAALADLRGADDEDAPAGDAGSQTPSMPAPADAPGHVHPATAPIPAPDGGGDHRRGHAASGAHDPHAQGH